MNVIQKIATSSAISTSRGAFAIALTATIVTGIAPAPASAQVAEILSVAGNALSSISNRQPQQQAAPRPQQAPINRSVSLGTNNLNGNNVHLCITGCTPTPQARPAMPPQGMPRRVVPMQQNQQVVRNGMPPQGMRPGVAVPPQQAQAPSRPTVIIPPIKLPINMPR